MHGAFACCADTYTHAQAGGPSKRTRAKRALAGALAAELGEVRVARHAVVSYGARAQRCGAALCCMPACHRLCASAQKRSGIFVPEEKEIFEDVKSCSNNLKEHQYDERKRTTAGALFMVSSCNLFVGVRGAMPCNL